MPTKMISIANDFSPTPSGRYIEHNVASGQAFRDTLLLPALREGEVTVDLDGVAGYGSSFLEEAFGGLIRKGMTEDVVRKRLRIHTSTSIYAERIWRYIKEEAQRVAA